MQNKRLYINFLLCFWLFLPPPAQAAQPETPEIVFTGNGSALPLSQKANELDNPVAIYEYVRNTFEFAPYHGSRSGSVNTFMGQRGNDVDIATALIAMLRSQNIPARYAVATVSIPYGEINNWLGTQSEIVSVQVLKDQGIQNVKLNGTTKTVELEHVWVEAKVPFEQYRGLPTKLSVDCSSSDRCDWIPLDASFKQKAYNGLNIDPYPSVAFNYTDYYNGIKNKSLGLVDKNPLTILEEQIAVWLRTNFPGKTLEDVADQGQIIEIHDGLLPASLPYQIVSTVRRYDSVADHDAAVANTTEPKKWGKKLTITVSIVQNGQNLPTASANILIATLNTNPLTLTTQFANTPDKLTVSTKLGDTVIATHVNKGKTTNGGLSVNAGDQLKIDLAMDGSPDTTVNGTNDRNIAATYYGIIGGYYLIATGGESSNWSQVHRAADQLLVANATYKIVFNTKESGCNTKSGLGCTPYVDGTNNGWDASDTLLLENQPALDALTGGLLYVAASQYYAKQREQYARADHLMKVKTPIIGFLGVVSSVYEAEYIDGTAFSILPGGLLIDMKGISVGGTYRINDNTYSSSHFELLGHIGSSLEHEIWQELTSYDAVSTVRGIQMALANGDELLNPKYSAPGKDTNTLPDLYTKFGFSNTVPSGFSNATFSTFLPQPSIWTHGTEGASFDMFFPTVGNTYSQAEQAVVRYIYSSSRGLTGNGTVGGGFYGWTKCVSELIKTIDALSDSGTIKFNTCNLVPYGYLPKSVAKTTVLTEWTDTIIPQKIGQPYFDFFDKAKAGFATGNKVYQSYPPEQGEYAAYPIANIRTDLYDRDVAQSWVEYLLPSRLVAAPNNYFSVDIRKQYETATGDLTSMSFEIQNLGGK